MPYPLTLIRAAGGVFDIQNFNNSAMAYIMYIFEIDVFLKKKSREYILLSTFKQKMAFSVIFQPKRARNPPFFRWFCIFRAA